MPASTVVTPVEKTRVETAYATFLPDRLAFEGRLVPERRKRGLFEAVVYAVELKATGTFPAADLRALGIDPDAADFGGAFCRSSSRTRAGSARRRRSCGTARACGSAPVPGRRASGTRG